MHFSEMKIKLDLLYGSKYIHDLLLLEREECLEPSISEMVLTWVKYVWWRAVAVNDFVMVRTVFRNIVCYGF